jgi:DNA-binding NarL/FixJ family response regulator
MPRPRILIADDHTLVAESCRMTLEPEFNVVGTVSDGRQLVWAAAKFRPEVIVADIGLPLLNGLDAAQRVKETFPLTKFVFLAMNVDAYAAVEALERGASGYLPKTCTISDLVTAVRHVLRGRTYLSPLIDRDEVDYLRLQRKQVMDEAEPLTMRQREVLQLLVEGKVMREVADILNMTWRTVAFHKYRIRDTLGAKSDADLVKYAIRNHMISAA